MRLHDFMLGTAYVLLAAVALTATPCLAGTISAELDHSEGAVGEPFVLTVAIEGARDGEPTIPQVDGLEFHQQGVSESTSWVNGQRSAQLQIGLVVVASKPGRFTIPSIKAKVDGQEVATLPLTLQVGADATGQAQNQPQNQAQNQAQSAAPNQSAPNAAGGNAKTPTANQNQAKDDGGKTGGVFLDRTCDRLDPYVGEQVLCTIHLYHRGNLNGGQRLMPSSPDFRRFPIDGEKRAQKLVNGQPYIVIELKEVVVATKPGPLTLPPYTIDARILTWTKRRNPIDKFFNNFGGGAFNFDMNFTEEQEVNLKSEPAEFTVKPLPQSGKPPGFSGLVGNFQLDTHLSQAKVAAGNTVTITITISGTGIADSLGDVVPSLEKIGKVYPDKPEYTEKVVDPSGIVSKRVYKYALVPANPGDFDLGKVQVPVFNPHLQQYTILTSELGHLIVDPSKAEAKSLVVGQQAQLPGTKKEDVKVLGSDLVDIHHGPSLSKQQTITRYLIFVLTLTGVFPSSCAFIIFGVQALRRRSEGDTVGKRRSRAYKVFKNELQAAQIQVAAGHVEPSLLAAYAALRTYLGDKLNLHGQSLASREIEELLRRLGCKEEDLQRLVQIIKTLEQVDFGGKLPSLTAASELVADLDRLVLGLEHA